MLKEAQIRRRPRELRFRQPGSGCKTCGARQADWKRRSAPLSLPPRRSRSPVLVAELCLRLCSAAATLLARLACNASGCALFFFACASVLRLWVRSACPNSSDVPCSLAVYAFTQPTNCFYVSVWTSTHVTGLFWQDWQRQELARSLMEQRLLQVRAQEKREVEVLEDLLRQAPSAAAGTGPLMSPVGAHLGESSSTAGSSFLGHIRAILTRTSSEAPQAPKGVGASLPCACNACVQGRGAWRVPAGQADNDSVECTYPQSSTTP